MEFESDPNKAAISLRKHGVEFDEAVTCLLDAMALVRDDPDAVDEVRHILIGMSKAGRMLTVVYTMRGEIPRIISARKATRRENCKLCVRNTISVARNGRKMCRI